jgi:hypothetical protein
MDVLPRYAEQECKNYAEKNDELENSLEDFKIDIFHLFLNP